MGVVIGAGGRSCSLGDNTAYLAMVSFIAVVSGYSAIWQLSTQSHHCH